MSVERCECGHAKDAHGEDGYCYGERYDGDGGMNPCECREFRPAVTTDHSETDA